MQMSQMSVARPHVERRKSFQFPECVLDMIFDRSLVLRWLTLE